MSRDIVSACLDQSVAGDPWHGPSLDALLADVTAEQAFARPVPGAHTIVELVLHLTAWMREVCERLRGGEPGLPAEGDWPRPGPEPRAAWLAARADLRAVDASLHGLVASLDPDRLHEPDGVPRDRALGTGVTRAAMLLGVAQHAAYHGGQIAVLKRALSSG
ncbi:MAG: DinB family protein [Acidobacteriota bacterium]